MAFAWLTAMSSTISGAFDLIKEPVSQWQERKTIRAKASIEVEKLYAKASVEKAKALVEMAKTNQQIQADWDARAQEQARFSIKDEILMIVLFSPVVALFVSAFLPDNVQKSIIQAVSALEDFPDWYVVMLLGIVASVFGLRWLVAPIVGKMQKLKKPNQQITSKSAGIKNGSEK